MTWIFLALGTGWIKLLLTITDDIRSSWPWRIEGKLVPSHISNVAINKQLHKEIWRQGEKHFGTCHCEDDDEDHGRGRRKEEEKEEKGTGECKEEGGAEGEKESKSLNFYTICYN